MKVLIAIDSFKGSMSTLDAGNAAKQGVLRVVPDADV
ncbi:MAG: glycerate kinase, partial [Clostridiales Family XIII bacterium]|nr:glycerate kinase [Clostridiales Family XIII bacterium]